jgi:hypothetical protein
MLRSMKELQGYVIEATEGTIGTVDTFLFDDTTWIIRYLVVDLGRWLPGRRVLLVPATLEEPSWDTSSFPVNLTKSQVETSPDIDTDQPVSRQQETVLHTHYGWQAYWDQVITSAPIPSPLPAMDVTDLPGKGNPHLRSTREVIGYSIGACDGEVGHVEDFIMDDAAWVVRYMVVDTRNWLPGREVLVAPQWITTVAWDTSQVSVDLSCEQVQGSPTYDPKTPVNRDYEGRLYDYYGRPAYWG